MDATPAREPHLDRLRTLAVLAIVAAHAVVPYMAHAPAWYVLDARRSIVFDGLGLVFEALCMPALFFVSGCVGAWALARSSPAAFLRARALRLLPPFLAALATISPFAVWLRRLRDEPGLGFAEAWLDFWGWNLNQTHLWYLPYLFLLSASAVAARWLRPGAFGRACEAPARPPSTAALVATALVIGLGKGLSLQVFADQAWFDLLWLNVQPSRVAVNVGFYAVGLWAGFGGWFRASPDVARARRGLALGLLLLPAYLLLQSEYRFAPTPWSLVLDGVLHAGLAVSVVLVAGDGLRAVRSLRVERRLQPAAYGIYLLHYLPVLGLGWLLRTAALDPWLKYAVVVGLSVPLAFLLAEGTRRLPLARRVL